MAAREDRLVLVAQIAASYVRRNAIAVDQIATVVRNATDALVEAEKELGGSLEPTGRSGVARDGDGGEARLPAGVAIEESVHHDYLVCLEDGGHFRSLKRHLRTAHGMTPQQYRLKWRLPPDYPMSAPASSEGRSAVAKARGLGRKQSRGVAQASRGARAATRRKPRRRQAKVTRGQAS
jgi:predicted transcriptional regulator